jgi:activator of HSP90 ATPase
MRTKTIRQTISFSASAAELYNALMSSKKHASFTGGAATISRAVGGSFSVYDGYATGKNIELVKDRKIVQSWRASDWEDGVVSQVSFLFTPTNTGCTLTFIHSGVPSGQYSSIKEGWKDFYWIPLHHMFKKA